MMALRSPWGSRGRARSSASASVLVGAVTLAAAGHGAAQTLDLSATSNCDLPGGHGVPVTLAPGTYLMQPVQGAFTAWFRWPGGPAGCDGAGGNCTLGWTVYWDAARADGAIEHYPNPDVPNSDRWATPELALAHATPVLLTVPATETVVFFIYDNPCDDNTGGVSLVITPACRADFNRDGTVNSTDVSDFINQWFTDQLKGTLVTDWDANGVVNSTDVSAFINTWFEDTVAGCG
jgi:hypothetical protein